MLTSIQIENGSVSEGFFYRTQNALNSKLYPDVLKTKTTIVVKQNFSKMPFFIYESISGYSVAWMSWQECGQMMDLKICK